MSLKEKYISTSENGKNPDATKTILSDDAYAICELIEQGFARLNQIVRGK